MVNETVGDLRHGVDVDAPDNPGNDWIDLFYVNVAGRDCLDTMSPSYDAGANPSIQVLERSIVSAADLPAEHRAVRPDLDYRGSEYVVKLSLEAGFLGHIVRHRTGACGHQHGWVASKVIWYGDQLDLGVREYAPGALGVGVQT